jgi:hypothetical protein
MRNDRRLSDDERGVSEVLGHALIFGIVVTSIGLVVVSGIAGLEDTREAERFQNADRAFDVLADNMASIYERDVPGRATEIDLGDAVLTHGDPVHLNVSLTPSNSDPVVHENYTVRPIEFRVDSHRRLVYEAGAVFRVQRDGGVVLEEPPYLITEDRIHFPIVRTLPMVERTVSGSTVLIRASSRDRTVLQDPSEGPFDEMTITITSQRAGLWAAYFATVPNVSCDDPVGDTLKCSVDQVPENTYLVYHLLGISFDL